MRYYEAFGFACLASGTDGTFKVIKTRGELKKPGGSYFPISARELISIRSAALRERILKLSSRPGELFELVAPQHFASRR